MAIANGQELRSVNDFRNIQRPYTVAANGLVPNIDADDDFPVFFISRNTMSTNSPRLQLREDDNYLGGVSDDEDDAPLICPSDGDESVVNLTRGRDHHCHSDKAPSVTNKARNQLICASCLVLLFMIAEIIGGYIANSLAIMTDAAHLLSDFASFLISLFAIWVAKRPATRKMSFGFYRAEVIGAVISVLIIWILTGVLVYLAIQRCIDQSYEIDADIMLITAGCGVAINLLLVSVLHQTGHGHSHGGSSTHSHTVNVEPCDTSQSNGTPTSQYVSISHVEVEPFASERSVNPCDTQRFDSYEALQAQQPQQEKRNINVRAAFIHVLGDLIQSVGVLVAAYIIKYRPEAKIVDPICTFIFSILVLFTTLNILKDAVHVLMEGAPKDIDYNKVKEDLMAIQGVQMAHSLHIWSLTMSKPALAVHLAIDPSADSHRILRMATRKMRNKYQIHHTTIQVELFQPTVMADCATCQGPTK
ncbi:proton-coupled zinc antiporter SLC30A2-like [Ptychodera flava]|uniref:proton-coupled zinc antiporter SLC30A2-like n=1 Tax=Ptychodera flava TaxID=63121 RepID=UPI00396A18E2